MRRVAEYTALTLSVMQITLELTGLGSVYFVSISLFVAMLLSIVTDLRPNAQVIATNMVLTYLFVIPSIGAIIFENIDYSYICAIAYIFILALRYSAKHVEVPKLSGIPRLGSQRRDMLTLAACLMLCTIGPYFLRVNEFIGLFAFLIPFAVSIVYLERISIYAKLHVILILLALYAGVLFVYVVFHWGGFGRIIVGAYILMPILIANGIRDLGVRSWQGVVLAVPALYVSQSSRHGEVGLENLHGGSASHHLFLTNDLYSAQSVISPSWQTFFEQWLLFYLNWMPRDLWSGKPIGIGLSFVDGWIGRAGFSDGFSVSVGFIGELIYYVGELWWVALFLCALTLISTRAAVAKFTKGYIAPLVVFDVSLLSYTWGGFATFGSRAWFMILPMLLLINVILPRVRRRQTSQWEDLSAQARHR